MFKVFLNYVIVFRLFEYLAMRKFRFFLLFALSTFIVLCDKEKTDLSADEVKTNLYSNLEKSHLFESVKEKIKKHLSEKYPGTTIDEIKIDDNQIDIKLYNEVEISFSLNGDPSDSDDSKNQTNIEFAHNIRY